MSLLVGSLLMNPDLPVRAVEPIYDDSVRSNSRKSPLEINISTSRICGLVYFVETIAGCAHTTPELRKWYLTKKSKDPKRDKLDCQIYSNILDDEANLADTPDRTGRQMTLSQRIACMSTECKTLNDLQNKLKTILPYETYSSLLAIYKHFEPVYDTCIWKPQYKRLSEQLDDFRRGVKRVQLLPKLEQVRKFMSAPWPANMPFRTVIIPLPDELKSSHADSIGMTQIVEVPAEQSFDDQSDILFHELCHSLWGKVDQKKVRKQFERIGGSAPYYELNEALATALGQGWFRQTSYPLEPPREVWYARDITENYGRGLFPLVSTYLQDGRRFDSSFVMQSSRIFQERCPQAGTDLLHTYAVHITFESTPDCNKLQNAMFPAMPNIRATEWERLKSANFARMTKRPNTQDRQIVLLSPKAIESLSKHGLPAAQVSILKHRTADCVTVTVNHVPIIFCIGEDVRSQENVFLKMLKTGYPKPSE